MRKKEIREDSEAPGEERAPKVRLLDSGDVAKAKPYNRTPHTGEERQAASTEGEAYPHPRSHRELGNAIFEESNPVKAGREILDESNDATRLNALKAFADWAYGERDGRANYKPPRIIWDIPGPPYEPPDPELLAPVSGVRWTAPESEDRTSGPLEEEKLEGGEK